MARKSEFTDAIDHAIGSKIHELRLSMGLSRQQLAAKIGVTHQQLQKYEQGSNRITLGRLVALARALQRNTSFFFENLESKMPIPAHHQRMCMEVSRNFMQIQDPDQQDAIHMLIRTLSRAV